MSDYKSNRDFVLLPIAGCEACDRMGQTVVRFNAKGIGLPFAICEECVSEVVAMFLDDHYKV